VVGQEVFGMETPVAAVRSIRLTRMLAVWAAVAAAVLVVAFADGVAGCLASLAQKPGGLTHSTLILVLLALVCEFIDATIGMGYGTTLSPVLLLLGFPIQAIIPAALLSQLAGNLSAAFFHHQVGNVDFLRDHRSRNVALVMGGTGLLMAVAAAMLSARVPAGVLKPLVSVMVVGVGAFVLIGGRLRIAFRWRNVAALAAVAGFNKAFTGGGYGPLVCGGQVLVGLKLKTAVASTALAEAVVCVATVATYLAIGTRIPLELVLPLTAGVLLSTPLSALALRRLPAALVRRVMGVAVLLLGSLSLVKVIGGGL
jgi:uncharacterized membrane protein YfcA